MKKLLILGVFTIYALVGFTQVQYIGIVSDSCENYSSSYTAECYSNGSPSQGHTYLLFKDSILIAEGGGGLGCCCIEDIIPLTDTVIFTAINSQGIIYYIRTLDGGANWSEFDNVGAIDFTSSRFFSENTGYAMIGYFSYNNNLVIQRASDIKHRTIVYQTTFDTTIHHIYISDTLYGTPYCPDINEIVYKFIKDSTEIFVHVVFTEVISNINIIENKNDINVFPNPAHCSTTIELKNDCLIEIIDMFGKVILCQDLYKGQNILNIANFNPGYYFIRFKTKNGVINKTLIKL